MKLALVFQTTRNVFSLNFYEISCQTWTSASTISLCGVQTPRQQTNTRKHLFYLNFPPFTLIPNTSIDQGQTFFVWKKFSSRKMTWKSKCVRSKVRTDRLTISVDLTFLQLNNWLRWTTTWATLERKHLNGVQTFWRFFLSTVSCKFMEKSCHLLWKHQSLFIPQTSNL